MPFSFFFAVTKQTDSFDFFTTFTFNCSKDSRASVVHGATDLQDNHDEQVQEETGAAHGLPQDVSFLGRMDSVAMVSNHV